MTSNNTQPRCPLFQEILPYYISTNYYYYYWIFSEIDDQLDLKLSNETFVNGGVLNV